MRSGRLLSSRSGLTVGAPRDTRSAPVVTGLRRARTGPYLGLVPFVLYVLLFLALPTGIAVGTGFLSGEGNFTLDNLGGLFEPAVRTGFINSIWVSAVTAVLGAVIGALVSYALITVKPDGMLRTLVDAASGVFAQFGGVALAFVFIAAMGNQGLVTVWLRNSFGVDVYSSGVWLYETPGLILPYLFFQIPLMVIVFLPALEALRPQWAEANASLGGTRRHYWLHIAGPVLSPSFFGSLLLLFGNAFAAYATAAALISQGSQIVPLQVRAALNSETVLGRSNLAGSLALGMIAVMVIVMGLYSMLERRALRWQR